MNKTSGGEGGGLKPVQNKSSSGSTEEEGGKVWEGRMRRSEGHVIPDGSQWMSLHDSQLINCRHR